MSAPITPEMKATAEALLKWSQNRFGRLFSDVLIWWRNPTKGHISLAFQGDALSIERNLCVPELVRNPPPYGKNYGPGYLDESMQTALGVVVGQTMDTPTTAYYIMLDGVETAVAAKLGLEDKFEYFSVFATIIPKEGVPWNPGSAETLYYSAKQKKVLTSLRPSWVKRGEVRDQETGKWSEDLVADVCSLVDPVSARACGTAIVGQLKGMQYFVTHSFTLGGRGPEEETASAIAKCGGLLYPSLAVGHLAANNFGPLTLFADVRMALLSLKPYKEKSRGRIEVPLYGTDVWTETTRHFLGDYARDLFLQLTGNPAEGMSLTQAPRYMAVLGPSLGGTGGFGMDEKDQKPLDSTSKMATVLQRRMKLWTEKANVEKIKEQMFTLFDQRVAHKPELYPYLEAKVHAKVPLNCFPLAVTDAQDKAAALKFLEKAGYSGPLLLLESVPKEVRAAMAHDNDGQATYAYSWMMRKAVLEYVADKPTMVVNVLT